MEVPNWLTCSMTKKDLALVEAAVAEVEVKTSGELVPMVIRRSSSIAHVQTILTLIWTVFFLGIIVELFEPFWFDSQFFWPGFYGMSIWTTLMGYLLGAGACWYLAKKLWWQRLLTRSSEQQKAVYQRAELEFYRQNIRKTRGKTGLLIFVSLMERRVIVLADEAINSKVTAGTWQQVVDLITREIGSESLAQGLCAGIRRVGEILAEHFPPDSENKNELANFLRLRSE